MTEFRIKWTACPTAYNQSHVLFIEAETDRDAMKIARDHVERKFGLEWLKVESLGAAEAMPAGRVKEAA